MINFILTLLYFFVSSHLLIASELLGGDSIIPFNQSKLDTNLFVRRYNICPNDTRNECIGSIEIYENSTHGIYELIQVIDSLRSNRSFKFSSFEDYNNDGLKDMKVIYGSGARGANVLNYIFLQKHKNNRTYFTYLIGSESRPNLTYNISRNVVESIRYHGGVTFEDYTIEDDSLMLLSSIDARVDSIWTIRSHYVYTNSCVRLLKKVDSIRDNGKGVFSRE